MKKLFYLTILLSIFIVPLNAAEKKNCSGFKKLSKAFISCKSANFKTGLTNAGNKIKKKTTGKNKKEKKIKKKSNFIITPTTKVKKTNSNNMKVSTGNKKATAYKKATSENAKKIFNKIFSRGTKQYPMGTK